MSGPASAGVEGSPGYHRSHHRGPQPIGGGLRVRGLSGLVSRLVKRYRLEGEAAFEPRSRRPHTSPTRLPQSLIDLIIALRDDLSGKGLDHGPRVLILVQDLDIHIINAATGDLTRLLTLDPTRDYQPAGAPKGPKRIRFRT